MPSSSLTDATKMRSVVSTRPSTAGAKHFQLPLSPAYTWFFLAMAEAQLGRAEDVQEWLAKAVQQAEQELADDETSWNRRATLELLRDEATALVAPISLTSDLLAHTASTASRSDSSHQLDVS